MPSPDFTQYIDLTPLDIDPAAAYTGAIELARVTIPEFTLRQGTPEDAMFQAMAFMSSLSVGALNRLPSRLMVGLANILGYSRFQGARATVSVDITVSNYDAGVIPAGTVFAWTYEDETGDTFQYAFELVDPVEFSAGTPPTLETETGNLRCVTPGLIPTLPPATSLTVITTNTAIDTAVTTNTFINGSDPDDDIEYMAAVTTYLRSLSSSVSTSAQLQAAVLSSFRDIARCRVYDLTDPSGSLLVGDPDAPGYATIFVYGRGGAVAAGDRSTIQQFIETKISASIVQDVLEFELCGVGVRASVVFDNSYAQQDVETRISNAVSIYLSPLNFPAYETQIRSSSVLAAIMRVRGVLYVTSVYLQPIGNTFTQKQWLDVRAATTANITISTALNSGDTLDGITLADGDRVLVKNQSTASENGIYVVGSSPARSTDANDSGEFAENKIVYVTSGTANAGTYWKQTTSSAITVGSTSIAFGSASPYENLEFIYKGSLPDPSQGDVTLTMTGESV